MGEVEICYGTKRIEAWPEEREHPEHGTPEHGYAVRYPDGYVSWSPKAVFEAAYRPSGRMTFGHAMEALKEGRRVARSGWNGQGMFLFLLPDWTYTDGKQDNYPNLPFIAMKTVGDEVVPWLASQTDMLAEDWTIVSDDA